jgi:hypothetical protein
VEDIPAFDVPDETWERIARYQKILYDPQPPWSFRSSRRHIETRSTMAPFYLESDAYALQIVAANDGTL